MREEIREQERKGREERMELRARVEGLEKKMEEMELGIREGKGKEEIAEGVKRGEKGEESVLVKLKNEDQKREMMKKKKELKGTKVRVMEDWTWMERKMRWRLEEIAREEERKGKRVWIGYGRIRIEEQWWKWDENEEVLKDEKGRIRERMQGEEKEERREEGN
ncbi:hypothetical protein X777_03894 [Ooceraea biroi]|uniref:Uncharacterized protein n=1 Tax=Ooceraea biroi TaxID=2015173 RepID=A0A026WJ46_OOCBI|nr:hypothetical protein X777_03894 [Ooceraea biroi]